MPGQRYTPYSKMRTFHFLLFISLAGLIPLLSHTLSTELEKLRYKAVSSYICKIVVPKIQMGSYRDVIEFLIASLRKEDGKNGASIEFRDGTQLYLIGDDKIKSGHKETCEIPGRKDIIVDFYFPLPTLRLNIFIFQFFLSMILCFTLLKSLGFLVGNIQNSAIQIFESLLIDRFSLRPSSLYPQPRALLWLRKFLNLDSAPVLNEIGGRITTLQFSIESQAKELASKETDASLAKLALQVAHDIQSPLSSLLCIAQYSEQLEDQTRAHLRTVVNRIRAISNSLLVENRQKRKGLEGETITGGLLSSDEKGEVHFLSSLVDSTLWEKRVRYSERVGIQIQDEIEYGVFAHVDATEFGRMVSNLVDNAAEALTGTGLILIRLKMIGEKAILEVIDNGIGIKPEVLSRLGKFGETYGKDAGSGLGLYHAKNVVKSWNGVLEIESNAGKGTLVRIHLPVASAPIDFVPAIQLSSNSRIIILDDDDFIHQMWKKRLERYALVHFFNPEDFSAWRHSTPEDLENTFYLLDYKLADSEVDGLDLISSFCIQDRAILVTNHAMDPILRERCGRLSVKIIPKALAHQVPVKLILS